MTNAPTNYRIKGFGIKQLEQWYYSEKRSTLYMARMDTRTNPLTDKSPPFFFHPFRRSATPAIALPVKGRVGKCPGEDLSVIRAHAMVAHTSIRFYLMLCYMLYNHAPSLAMTSLRSG